MVDGFCGHGNSKLALFHSHLSWNGKKPVVTEKLKWLVLFDEEECY